jgi:cell division septum initiation protein DivIVA
MSANDLTKPGPVQDPARPALIPRRSADAIGAPPAPQHVTVSTGFVEMEAEETAPRTTRAAMEAASAAAEGRPGRAPVAAGLDPHEVAGVPRPEPHGARLTGMDRTTEQAAELVIDLLDAIESLVVNGRRVPFSTAVMVNEEEVLDYIDRARTSLPEDLKQARAVVDRQREFLAEAEEHAGHLVGAARTEVERMTGAAHGEAERVVAAAHAEAQRVMQTGREHAAALVSTHAISQAAEQNAEEIAARAAAGAAAERAQADAYARDLLAGLAVQVEKALGQLHRGMEMLPADMSEPVAASSHRRRR